MSWSIGIEERVLKRTDPKDLITYRLRYYLCIRQSADEKGSGVAFDLG
jgi:hypothetical protein